LGEDFLHRNQIIIDFHEEYFHKGEKDGKRRYSFSSTRGENVGENETNRGQTDHTTDAPLSSIRTAQPTNHEQSTSVTSRQEPELEKRPYKVIKFGKAQMLAVMDTVSQVSVISKKAYTFINKISYTSLQLPAKLITIKAGKSLVTTEKRVLKFKIDGDVFETPLWVI
jgi:hypothetical protein